MNESNSTTPTAEKEPRALSLTLLKKWGAAITAVAAAGGLYFGFGRGNGAAPDQAPGIECVIPIKPGDTLWRIAEDTLPDKAPTPPAIQSRVDDIQDLNHLPTTAIIAGDELGLSPAMCAELDTPTRSWRE